MTCSISRYPLRSQSLVCSKNNSYFVVIEPLLLYMAFPTLKQNKAFKEKVERCLSSRFLYLTSQQIRKTMNNENTCVLAILNFYENINLLIYKALGVVDYCFLENIFVLTIFVYRKKKMYLLHRGFKTLHLMIF